MADMFRKKTTMAFQLEEDPERLENRPFSMEQYNEFVAYMDEDNLVSYIMEAARSHRSTMLQDVSDDQP